MRAILCLLPAAPPGPAAPAVPIPPARLLSGFPARVHVERALDGPIYCTVQPAPSWATAVAQAQACIAALQSTGVQCDCAGLAAARFPAACAATLAAQGTLHILPPGTEAAALAPLPITQLPDVSPQLLREFQQLRLFTLGDLAACPAPLLRAVFGPAVLRLQRLACGEDPGLGAAHAPADSALTATRPLLPGSTPAETTALMAALAGDLAVSLGAAGRTATTLTLTVRFAAGPSLHKTTRLPAHVTDAPAIHTAVTPLLAALLRARRSRPAALPSAHDPTTRLPALVTDAPAIHTAVTPLLAALLRARRSRPAALHLAVTRSCDAVYQPPLPAPPSAHDPTTRLQTVLADLQARFGPDIIQLGATRVPPSPLPHAAGERHGFAPVLQVTHALHASTHP